MSTAYQGVNYAKTQQTPFEAIDEGQFNSPTKMILDQFVLTADLAANDTILVGGPIPEGAVILNAKIIVPVALGGSAALNFGWNSIPLLGVPAGFAGTETLQATDSTAFFSGVVVSSAVVATALGSAQQGDFYTQAAITSQVQPVVTCTVATSGATGKSIYFEIAYCKSGG